MLVNARDHHASMATGGFAPQVERVGEQLHVICPDRFTLRFQATGGQLQSEWDWIENFDLPVERERGLPDRDAHLCVGQVLLTLRPGAWVGVVASLRDDASPYDPDARYSTQRSVEGVGYNVHLTETCDPDTPRLIVNVETTPATTPDDNMIAVIHASLAQRNPLPVIHLMDKGYTSAQVLLDSQRDYQVAIVGPVADDPSWQDRADEGFAKADF